VLVQAAAGARTSRPWSATAPRQFEDWQRSRAASLPKAGHTAAIRQEPTYEARVTGFLDGALGVR
jgi:hypothetical protein